MYQLDWSWGAQIQYYFGCVCEGFWMRLAFEQMDSSNLLRAWKEQEAEGRNLPCYIFFSPDSLIELGHLISSLVLGQELNTIRVPPGSQAFEFKLNYNTSFPGSAACRQQIVGLLSLQNCVSQFLIMNLQNIYFQLFPCDCKTLLDFFEEMYLALKVIV